MKIILCLFIINSFNNVYTQFNAVNYIQTPNVQNSNLNYYNNGQSSNLRNRETINYQTQQYTNQQNPFIQKQFTSSNNVQQQSILISNQRNRGTVNYQTLQYTANQNPLIANQFTFSNNVQNQNSLNSKPKGDQRRLIQYNTNVRRNPASSIRSPTPVRGIVQEIGIPSSARQYSAIEPPKRNIQGRSLGTPSSQNLVTTQKYSNIPVRGIVKEIGIPSSARQYSAIEPPKRNNQGRSFGTPSSPNLVATQKYSNIPVPNRNTQGRSLDTASPKNVLTNPQYSNIQLPNRNIQGRTLSTNPQYSNIPVLNRNIPGRAPNRNTQGRGVSITSSANLQVPTQQYSNIPLTRSNPQGRVIARQSTATPQQYSTSQQLPKRSIVNSITPRFESRFDANDNFSNQSTHPDTFQYQYSKGWSVHEALSVDDLVKPQLEYRKNLKYSTPYTPEDQYYQKFYNIYNEVENHGRPDLIQYEKESVNDDFNGRSIVAPGQYPHMAAVGFLSNEDVIEFKCGGSLISDLFVITAAHCCYLSGETPIIVKLGIINLKDQSGKSDPQRRAIKEIIVHPSYNASMTYHDIALLKLQKPVEFTKFVRPILLWTSDHIPYERVFTMGYGSTSFAKPPTNILTELSLSLIPWQKCKQSLPPSEKTPHGITETQICGRDLEKNRDTCQGDSGGPLQLNLEHRKHRNTYRYYLVGIISYGEFCGSKKPGVYTRVSSYCKWIASIVWPEYFQRFQKN